MKPWHAVLCIVLLAATVLCDEEPEPESSKEDGENEEGPGSVEEDKKGPGKEQKEMNLALSSFYSSYNFLKVANTLVEHFIY